MKLNVAHRAFLWDDALGCAVVNGKQVNFCDKGLIICFLRTKDHWQARLKLQSDVQVQSNI